MRKMFRRMLSNTGATPDMKLLNDVMTNPQAMADLLRGAKTPEDVAHRLMTKLVGASQAAEYVEGE
jgi:hypothetical protein